MTARVIFKAGDPKISEGIRVEDNRLYDREGKSVVITEVKRPIPPHLKVYIKEDGARLGLIKIIDYGQTFSGDELGLPNIETVIHIPQLETLEQE